MASGALAALLALGGVPSLQATDWTTIATDRAGNVYPEWCRRDLSGLNVTKMRVPLAVINKATQNYNKTLYGVWIIPKNAKYEPGMPGTLGVILLAEESSGWKAEEDEHHEECHAATYQRCVEAGGKSCDGAWHP